MSRLLDTLQKLRLLPQVSHLQKVQSTSKPHHAAMAQKELKQLEDDAIKALRRRVPIYLASAVGFVSVSTIVGTVTHYNDKYFPYYPFPFAIDIGDGPSMLPTMIPGVELYWRDCWSDRFFWFNWRHLRDVSKRLLGDDAPSKPNNELETSDTVSYKRPWQRGDVVTIFNPYSKRIICKRIIGLPGDTVQLFGEYAKAYHDLNEYDESCGVPRDERYSVPFCDEEAAKQRSQNNNSIYQMTIIVPPHHVWVEGDNPLYSTDSRHFGPLPISSLRGRVALRLWPIRRHIETDISSNESIEELRSRDWCALSSERPRPFMNAEEMLRNKDYGVTSASVQEPGKIKDKSDVGCRSLDSTTRTPND